MNRYILIRRLRGPALLLLIGIIALLHTAGVVHSFWHLFWPLLFILLGVLLLAERAALAAEGGYPAWPYPGAPGPGGVDSNVAGGAAPHPQQPPTIVPESSHDFGKDSEGGQS
jgi:LiaF transmembrane domain